MEKTGSVQQFKIYNVYSDNMLVQQNKPFVIAGEGLSGSKYELLLKKDNDVIERVTAIADKNCEWRAKFKAVNGGFDTYSIVVYFKESVVATIKNIVFGELWLASGQSNMLMNLWETPEGNEWYKNNNFPGKTLRLFTMPTTYGTECQKAKPQKELAGSRWFLGNDISCYSFSAVAYHFGLKLQNELSQKSIDVPIGIINASLGETYIESWISRNAIDNNQTLKTNLMEIDKYVSIEDGWGESLGPTTMTACYNLKVSPLTDLNIAGVIWYQGESNAEAAYKRGFYTNALECLIKDWSAKFGYNDKTIPFIMSHIAPFGRITDGMQRIWEEMSEVWHTNKNSMAQIPIYDIPLEWDYSKFTDWHKLKGNIHPIHPYNKKTIGERMATAAISLVYGSKYEHSAPVYESQTVNENYIDIKFANVCDGLKIKDNTEIYGFTICGADGVYLDAKAQIIAKDTVRVWNDNLKNPISVAYAYLNLPTTANICSEYAGETLFMVVPFRTKIIQEAVYFTNQHWMTCDDLEVYHALEMTPDLYNTWESTNALISIDKNIKYSGTCSLKIDYTNTEFSVYPVINTNAKPFRDVSLDYSMFKGLTFYIKSDNKTLLKSLIFKFDNQNTITAELKVEDSANDTAWKKVTALFDFEKQTVSSIKLCFTSGIQNGTIYIDDFSFMT